MARSGSVSPFRLEWNRRLAKVCHDPNRRWSAPASLYSRHKYDRACQSRIIQTPTVKRRSTSIDAVYILQGWHGYLVIERVRWHRLRLLACKHDRVRKLPVNKDHDLISARWRIPCTYDSREIRECLTFEGKWLIINQMPMENIQFVVWHHILRWPMTWTVRDYYHRSYQILLDHWYGQEVSCWIEQSLLDDESADYRQYWTELLITTYTRKSNIVLAFHHRRSRT